jgi:flagellar biosynthesis protein FliR
VIAGGLLFSTLRPSLVLATFLLFCRIGACLMVIPGFGSNRIPMRVRLFIAFGISLALSPLLVPDIQQALPDEALGTVSFFIGAELLTGLFIGFLGRIFIAALETLTTLVSMAIGLSNMPGMPIDGVDALPPVANLFTLTATAMIFIADQHWEILRGLVQSYEVIPPGQSLGGDGEPGTVCRAVGTHLCAGAPGGQPVYRLHDRREPRRRADQQTDTPDPGLLHLTAVRDRGRPLLPLPRRSRSNHDLPRRVLHLASIGLAHMARNSREIERMFKMQEQILKLSSWILQDLDSQAHKLNEKERRILLALSNGDLAQHDRFIANAAERLRRIIEEMARITAAREKVNAEFERQRHMLKTMSERLAVMRGEEQRANDERELQEYLDRRYG